VFDRTLLERPSLEVAPLLLGALLTCGDVSVRITEVEAYLGADDPGSHSFRGKTKRNATMFGEPGHLYTYFTYGMHVCANVVCSPSGVATAVLIRAGEVVRGIPIAEERRPTAKNFAELARGPARLVTSLGILLADDGDDLASGRVRLDLADAVSPFAQGPRTGVSGAGGTVDFPWRFWIPGDPTVSPYKRSVPKKRAPILDPLG